MWKKSGFRVLRAMNQLSYTELVKQRARPISIVRRALK